ncbi:DUF6311 domain-containing protein [Pseudomonas rhizoryzae]|uniref:DUF6311 domain-containing protein n=1 Tax=Pseudomonas rhizoryzae TaxID=2571129 RepID=UPI0007370D5F|nr:DUF6311 domain-containing protein [Pseudomonas rhizoryzae]KTT37207.1 hypothetical protein SB9_02700 [Pseudomonas psychrotolerans]KTT71149.1 hypothetical protein SB18R_22410 [Pseudomonas psychrotolerans]
MNRYQERIGYLLPALLGFGFFWAIFGLNVANPLQLEWLSHGDMLQSYLGWDYFRDSPWTFPIIGLNPRYGLEIAGSIVYADANPLLAVVFKVFSALLPQNFQYFGLWLLACCMLSAVVSWKILSLYTDSLVLRTLGICLILFCPAWLNRVGHINLMAHFLILLAIYLCLAKDCRRIAIKWGGLIALACVIHFYLAMMVLIFWGAQLFSRVWTRKTGYRAAALEAICILAGTYGVLYVFGYFTVKDVSIAGGYGTYNSSLLSPFMSGGWSYLFDRFNLGAGNFETLNYWGLGVFFLIAINAVELFRRLGTVRWSTVSICLLIAVGACFAIATTYNIQWGDKHWVLPLPGRVLDALSIFRGSSRFYWPITYLVVIGLIYLTLKSRSKNMAIAILSVAVVLQVADISKGFARDRFYFFHMPDVTARLTNSFWRDGLHAYKTLRYVPFTNDCDQRLALGFEADQADLATNSVCLARVSKSKVDAMNLSDMEALAAGRYASDTLYVVKDGLLGMVSPRPGDRLFKIDGLNVLAPGLQGCEGCTPLPLDQGSKRRYALIGGWSVPEDFGVWSSGKRSTLLIRNQGPSTQVQLRYRTFLSAKTPQQRFIFKVDGRVLREVSANGNGEVSLQWAAPAGEPVSRLTIELPDAHSPRDAGMSTDSRVLGIGLEQLSVQ